MKWTLACEHRVSNLPLTVPQCDGQQEDGCLHRYHTLEHFLKISFLKMLKGAQGCGTV